IELPGNDMMTIMNPPCQAGTEICSEGAYGDCVGEIGPGGEVCNDVDDDCDGTTDEDTGGDPCDSACGVGTTVCECDIAGNCQLVCSGGMSSGDEECNGEDD